MLPRLHKQPTHGRAYPTVAGLAKGQWGSTPLLPTICTHNDGVCLVCSRRGSLRERGTTPLATYRWNPHWGLSQVPERSDQKVGWWMTMVISPTDYSSKRLPALWHDEQFATFAPRWVCYAPRGFAREVYQPRRMWTKRKQDESTYDASVLDGPA